MRAERIAGLARFVISLQANGAHTAAEPVARAHARRQRQPPAHAARGVPRAPTRSWCSRPTSPPGLEVREDVIRRHVAEQMPFMATERWLMLGVGAGGDRQALHEVIRRHSLAVAEAVSRGAPNDLLDRLAADPAFRRVPAAVAPGGARSGALHRPRRAAGGRVPRRVPPSAARARPAARGRGRRRRGARMTRPAAHREPAAAAAAPPRQGARGLRGRRRTTCCSSPATG